MTKRIDRMSVNRMKLVNDTAEKENIRAHLGGIPACEIERKLNIRSPWNLAFREFYDYPLAESVDESVFLGEILFRVLHGRTRMLIRLVPSSAS